MKLLKVLLVALVVFSFFDGCEGKSRRRNFFRGLGRRLSSFSGQAMGVIQGAGGLGVISSLVPGLGAVTGALSAVSNIGNAVRGGGGSIADKLQNIAGTVGASGLGGGRLAEITDKISQFSGVTGLQGMFGRKNRGGEQPQEQPQEASASSFASVEGAGSASASAMASANGPGSAFSFASSSSSSFTPEEMRAATQALTAEYPQGPPNNVHPSQLISQKIMEIRQQMQQLAQAESAAASGQSFASSSSSVSAGQGYASSSASSASSASPIAGDFSRAEVDAATQVLFQEYPQGPPPGVNAVDMMRKKIMEIRQQMQQLTQAESDSQARAQASSSYNPIQRSAGSATTFELATATQSIKSQFPQDLPQGVDFDSLVAQRVVELRNAEQQATSSFSSSSASSSSSNGGVSLSTASAHARTGQVDQIPPNVFAFLQQKYPNGPPAGWTLQQLAAYEIRMHSRQ